MVAVSFHMHAHGKQACFLRIAIRLGLRFVDGLALVTPILLAARWIQPIFTWGFGDLQFGHFILSFYIILGLVTLRPKHITPESAIEL